MFTPHYQITDQIVNQLTEIAEIKSMVERSQLLPAREIFLRQTATIKMAHTSTSIEGNILQEYQVAKVVKGEQIKAPDDQIKEVTNYLNALKQITSISQQKSTFNTDDILAIHKQVMKGLIDEQKIGVWRKGPVYIVNVSLDGDEKVMYSPPEANLVSSLINELLVWVFANPQIHPIIRAGLFHYQFETIHPFPDGNGRVGRLLTLLALYQSAWDFKKVIVLEDFYNRYRKEYYQALQTGNTFIARHDADLTSWLEYYVRGFLDEALRVKNAILNISVDRKFDTSPVSLTNDELQIIDFVISMGKITSDDVVDILQIPKRTAQSKLKRLEENHIINKQGSGPATYYVVIKEG